MKDTIPFHPSKFNNTYNDWMENVHDWNISRQLWWGHQIPAFYYGERQEDFVVAVNKKEALEIIERERNLHLTEEDLRQDEDVLDTWFSSWLWPISVFDGINDPNNKEINYYYPTQDLVTGPDIIFFWVARMIMAGYEYRNDFPFKNVYFTGIVRDKQGRKMSKSLGNSPDPIELMQEYGADAVRVGMLLTAPAGTDLDLFTGPDIIFFWVARMIMAGYEYRNDFPFKNVYFTGIVRDKQGRKMSKSLGNSPDPIELMQEYGADAVRVGMLLTAPAGNDLPFDTDLCLQGRNFANKIWNAFRLIKGWQVDESIETPEENKFALNWFNVKFNSVLQEIESNYEKYRISDVLMSVYKLIWDDFCSWYLEAINPEFGKPI